jgi:hypothetical protein
MNRQIEIIQRFNSVLKEINKLIDELKVEAKKDELIVRVSIIELVGIGEIMKDKKIKKYSVLREEWLSALENQEDKTFE